MNEEKIMVCVYYGPSGERLIQRGIQLAHVFGCPLFVLYVSSCPMEELDAQQKQYVSLWTRLAEEAGATFIFQMDTLHNTSKMISETAREKQITQVIIGQSPQSRWKLMTRGSFARKLLNQIGEIDLHILSVPTPADSASKAPLTP